MEELEKKNMLISAEASDLIEKVNELEKEKIEASEKVCCSSSSYNLCLFYIFYYTIA